MLRIEEVGARTILTPQNEASALYPDYDFSLNPYQGCGMGCAYCYVMGYPFAEAHPLAWGKWVRPKVNAAFLLGKARAKVWGKRLFMSSATDPYQYVERRYRLTRDCLKVLLECNIERLTVHTRSHLILEDLDLLTAFRDRVEVGFSVPTDDDRVRQRLEPHAPTIDLRMRTMRKLRESGIRVWASVAPMVYCCPDRFASLLAEVAEFAWIGRMRWDDRTGFETVGRAARFVKSREYEALMKELVIRFRAVGLMT